jgi:hypothetical protein
MKLNFGNSSEDLGRKGGYTVLEAEEAASAARKRPEGGSGMEYGSERKCSVRSAAAVAKRLCCRERGNSACALRRNLFLITPAGVSKGVHDPGNDAAG